MAVAKLSKVLVKTRVLRVRVCVHRRLSVVCVCVCVQARARETHTHK
jgi:hypothetical protein